VGARYEATVRGDDFELRLDLDRTQPVLLQGDRGFSRKARRRRPRATTTASRT